MEVILKDARFSQIYANVLESLLENAVTLDKS
jgi:hypothetical protein